MILVTFNGIAFNTTYIHILKKFNNYHQINPYIEYGKYYCLHCMDIDKCLNIDTHLNIEKLLNIQDDICHEMDLYNQIIQMCKSSQALDGSCQLGKFERRKER